MVSVSSGGYVTSLLPTVEVDEIQTPGEVFKFGADGTTHGTGVSGQRPRGSTSSTVLTGEALSKTVVVAFVGGVTHSELAALRQVAAFDEGRRVDIFLIGVNCVYRFFTFRTC